MVSRYSIIQYVPDAIANERINIGVLAFDDQVVRVKFLAKWNRVVHFAPSADISFLRDFSQDMQSITAQGLLFPGDCAKGQPNHERLLQACQNWCNSIQFTEPKGSLEKVDDLLAEISQRFLVGPLPKAKVLRDRQAAAQVATTHIRATLQKLYSQGQARELLRKGYRIQGKHKKHQFDVTVANGHPLLAVHGISFEIHPPAQILDSLAFMILDIKESAPPFPLAVVALPPAPSSNPSEKLSHLYQEHRTTYETLGARVIGEEEVECWAMEQLQVTEQL